MSLCVSALLLLLLAQTWTAAHPSPDHHAPDHDPHHGTNHSSDHASGPGSEECSKFNSPLSLKDKTPVLGRFHFLVGFTDNGLYMTLLRLTSSFWFNITETQDGLQLTQYNKMNGTCVESRAKATITEDTAHVIMHNITNDFQFINVSRTSMILNIKASASDMRSFIQKLGLDPGEFPLDLRARSFYLMSREAEVSEADLQLFRDHAECEGFTGEPHYIHQRGQEYCSVEESILTIY